MYSKRGPHESRQIPLKALTTPDATRWRSSGATLDRTFNPIGNSRSPGLKYTKWFARLGGMWFKGSSGCKTSRHSFPRESHRVKRLSGGIDLYCQQKCFGTRQRGNGG